MISLRPHNQMAVNELVDNYNKGVRTQIYVSGVGTGKSYVFFGLLDKLFVGKKVLYIIPKHSVAKNIQMYTEFLEFSKNIDFLTFNVFATESDADEILSKYDFVVIDEVHHIGSKIYGKNLLKGMARAHIPFLGLTATPERRIKDDNVCQYFEKTVYGLSLFEAIQNGLMPPIEYRLGLPEKDLAQIQKEYNNEVKAKISYIKSEKIIKEIVAQYPRNKWVCFFNTSEAIEENLPMIQRAFDGYSIHILLSSLRNLQDIMTAMKNEEKCVILSVNILLEGVHIPGIEGVALFRSCTSVGTFQQIIGRACSLSNKVSPVVLDCSQTSVKLMRKLMNENTKYLKNVRNEKSTSQRNKEIVRIGVGAHIHYDINELFKLADVRRSSEELRGNAQAAFERYKSFGGKIYDSADALESSKSDMQKARACCNLYKTTTTYFVQVMADNCREAVDCKEEANIWQ